MSSDNKVPDIRFKEFSEDWEREILGNLISCFSGGTPLVGTPEYYKGNIPFIRSGEINKATTELAISELGLKNSSARIVKSGTVLYALYGATSGEVGIARVCGAINQAILAIVPEANVSSGFLAHWLRKNKGNIVNTYLQGGQGNLSGQIVKNLILKLPGFEEQTQIGNYFQKLDTLINQHQQKHDKLCNIKKAMLEKMFPKPGETTPEIRFKGFSGEWYEVSLSDFGVTTSGTSIESEFSSNGKYKVISIGSYSENSVYTDQGLRANLSSKTESRVLNENDLTMILNDKTLAGNIIGRVLIINENNAYVYNQRTQRIEPFDAYDSQFLYQYLNAPLIREKIFKSSQGNTQIYVNWSAICKLKYFIPKKEEQITIGSYFQKLDKLIDEHQQQISKLNNIKQACLSKMFV